LRFQGKIKSWNQSKGFGFITPNGGGNDVFLHISSFTSSSKMPTLGSLITYEITVDESKRQKAVNARFVGEKVKEEKSGTTFDILKILLTLCLVVFVIYDVSQHHGSTIQATVYKSIFVRDYIKTDFQCGGKTYCSEMSSCKEALFYRENCSGTEMDGDNDGIPCEQQWCS